eukprot:CAMPEP_0174839690 /NCGR_PEP_ID=MMETSP1114-20130205/8207_1 /TAXON_ID=312471 /ORGANISM="Neobodo designis, Strain CCAP 1951/1" /LENGTH=278 /DNA_ID=CAMNT_0016073817 /DNA_START=32 /DNA_END=869 /DNA_ORIENTATION=+
MQRGGGGGAGKRHFGGRGGRGGGRDGGRGGGLRARAAGFDNRRPPKPREPRHVGPSAPTESSMSFNTFEFQEEKTSQKRGGGVREIHVLLSKARKAQRRHEAVAGTYAGEQARLESALETAAQRITGTKIRDDPTRLARALAKRKQKKRKSAKQWAARVEALEKSVDDAVEDVKAGRKVKSNNMSAIKARKDAKSKKKHARKAKKAAMEGKKTGNGPAGKKKAAAAVAAVAVAVAAVAVAAVVVAVVGVAAVAAEASGEHPTSRHWSRSPRRSSMFIG